MEYRNSVVGPAIVIIVIMIISHVMTIFTLVNIRQQIDMRMDRIELLIPKPGVAVIPDGSGGAIRTEWVQPTPEDLAFEKTHVRCRGAWVQKESHPDMHSIGGKHGESETGRWDDCKGDWVWTKDEPRREEKPKKSSAAPLKWTPDENGNVRFEGNGSIGFEAPKALTPGTVVYPMYDKAGKLLYVESGEGHRESIPIIDKTCEGASVGASLTDCSHPRSGQIYMLGKDGKWGWVPATWNSTKGDWEVKKEK